MNPTRFLRHLFTTRWNARRHFAPQVLAAIEATIKDVEANHNGEIRFAIETALDLAELTQDVTPRRRALQVFGLLGVWDTAGNNGVLIYLLLADHTVEIVADRGIAARVTQAQWEEVCREMERHYREHRWSEGSIGGIRAVAGLLTRHFPGSRGGGGELPDQPVLL